VCSSDLVDTAADLAGMTSVIEGMPTTAGFNVVSATPAVANQADVAPITAKLISATGNTARVEAIVLPGADIDFTVNFTLADGSAAALPMNGKNFVSGKQYIYNVTLDVATEKANIESEGIEGWGDGDEEGENVTTTKTPPVVVDEIIPVTFPVSFPVGKLDENSPARFTQELQPYWISDGLWICQDQPQAYATWHKVSDPSTTLTQSLEIYNSGLISTPWIRGIWTGDYMEFTIPVENFDADSKIRVQMSLFGRSQPAFWNIKYLDGEEWKTIDFSEKTFATETKECTFSVERDVIKYVDYTATFANEIESGYIKIRLECVDGSIQCGPDGVLIADTPLNWSGRYQAPFYFGGTADTLKEISFSLVQ
jgi:hypothetical protein